MFEKEATEYATVSLPDGYTKVDYQKKVDWQKGAEFAYNKANEWHFVKDEDLPKENQKCYFIYSNTYDKSNNVSFAEGIVQVRTGVYSFFYDEEGYETTEPCFYDDINDEEIGLREVYAWKEIVLPQLEE